MKELADILREEAEHAEGHRDAPMTADTVVTRRGGRARVFSLRMSEDEVTALEHAAAQAGVPASALARTWIIERLASEGGTTDLHAMAQTLESFSRRLAAL